MIEWITDTFNLLFSGANQLLTAVLRLGIVVIAVAAVWAYIRAVIKDPLTMIRGSLAIVALFGIGFGSVILIPKYLPVPTIVIWIGGWITAYYIAMFIGGWKDEKPH